MFVAMSVFEWAATESRTNVVLCRLVERQPLFAWLHWNTGVGMDLVHAGLKCIVVVFASAMLALVGLALSVFSGLVDRAVPIALMPLLRPDQGDEHALALNCQPQPCTDVSSTPSGSKSVSTSKRESASSVPSTPSSQDVRPVPAVATEASSQPTASSKDVHQVERPQPEVLQPAKVVMASPPTPAAEGHHLPGHDHARKSLLAPCVKRFTTALDQHKRPTRTQSLVVHSASSATPSLPSTSALQQQQPSSSSAVPEPLRPVVSRMSSAPHELKNLFLPRKQSSVPPPQKRTDPYAAPYFFPTPGSPHAVDYVRQVQLARRNPQAASQAQRSPRSTSPEREAASAPPTTEPSRRALRNANEAAEQPAEQSASRRRSWQFSPPRLALSPVPTRTKEAADAETHPHTAHLLQRLAPKRKKSSSQPPHSRAPLNVALAETVDEKSADRRLASTSEVVSSAADSNSGGVPAPRKGLWRSLHRR